MILMLLRSWLLSGMAILQSAMQNGLLLDVRARYTVDAMCSVMIKRDHMLDIIWHHHAAECLEPKDRIFALCGLLDSASAVKEIPLTSYSDEWVASYKALALRSIKQRRGANLLCHIFAFGIGATQNAALPSWVPDWSKARRYADFLTEEATFSMEHMEHADVLKVNRRDGSCVSIQGTDHGKVCLVIGGWSPDIGLAEVQNYLAKFVCQTYAHVACGVHGKIHNMAKSGKLVRDIARMLSAIPAASEPRFGPFGGGEIPIESKWSIRDQITSFINSTLRGGNGHRDPNGARQILSHEFICHFRLLLAQNSLYHLCNGVVGLGPQDLQKGDFAVGFWRSETPGSHNPLMKPRRGIHSSWGVSYDHNLCMTAALHPTHQLTPDGHCLPRQQRQKFHKLHKLDGSSKLLGPCFSQEFFTKRSSEEFKLI
jgi:hypothetical protein